MEPLKPTSDVFSESVLKVEFLPLPAQVPDFTFNLNTEASYVRFAHLMNGIIGPMRVEGCAGAFDFNNITVQPGLMMMGPFLVRVADVLTLSADNGQMLYAKCSIVRYTSDNHPEVVNINPPLAPVALAGPNQYRSTVEFVVAESLPANTSTDCYYKILETDVNGNVSYQLYLYDRKLGAMDLGDLVNEWISKRGTTATEFRVGIGSLNNNLGFKVALEADFVPKAPKNFRLTDIAARGVQHQQVAIGDALSRPLQSGSHVSPDAVCSLEWNWRAIVGTGSPNAFTVADGPTWSVNELTDYWLYIPQIMKNLRIVSNLVTSNGSTVLTVVGENGLGYDLSGVVVSEVNPAQIHCNVDTYEVVAIPLTRQGVAALNDRIEQNVSYGESPVVCRRGVTLMLGQSYYIKVRSVVGSAVSAWVTLSAGYFDKYEESHTYAMPLLVRLPNIPGLLEVGATSMPAGFRLVLGSCPDAHAFEVVYAESPVQPDFTSNTVGHLIATNRTIDISVPSGRVWNVKVRPLQGGQCVGAAVSASVTSGSSSSVGQEIPLAQFRIHLRSYSTLYLATSLYERPGDESFAFSNVRGIDSALIQDIPTEYIGRIFLDILGHEFVLSEKRDQLAFDMIDVDGLGASPTPAPGTPIVNGTIQANKIYRVVGFASVKYNSIVVTTNQQFVGVAGVVSWTDEVGSGSIVQVGIINGSRRGRNVYRSEYYTQDYRLTRVAVRADVVVGNPVLVWYQDSAPTQYDTYAVPAGNGATTFKETSVIISRDKGIRSLVVDLWDPSLANQAAPQSSGLTGLVTIYGIPYHNVSAIQTD